MRVKIDHLEYAHLKRALSILGDLAERTPREDFDAYSRAFTAHTVLGDMLEHDLEPEIIHTRPMDFRSLVTVMPGGRGKV